MAIEENLSQTLLEALEKTEVGKKLTLSFHGLPVPVDVKYTLAGGWIIEQHLIPGMALEITKGEPGALAGIEITIQPQKPLK
ncbi:hypothetical protein [Pseudomonas shahriarae]|uniref:hypothetical protein n=1 Tax=Pseudomonas shahriarae TaxID=2745512 RepID=UPI002360A3F3|nr:hypothetical protein [Pseudomonas shahriarae]MDD1130484.1 hypothetical protein [Pseudomonas shahriarae]